MASRPRYLLKSWWALPITFVASNSQSLEAIQRAVNSEFTPLVAFQRFDTDRSGVLDVWEFRAMCGDLALDEADAANMDVNKDGVISPQEFTTFLTRKFQTHQPAEQADFSAASAMPNFIVHRKQQQIATAAVDPKELASRLTNGPATGGAVCGEGGKCSGHGTCDTSTGKCVCDVGYTGDACSVQHCPGFAETGVDCYAHGACHTGKCECADGWGTFPNRSVPLDCMDKICQFPCGAHGQCVAGGCMCFQGWTGQMCRDPQCPGDCSGHGSCMMQTMNGPGECTCDYGWAGAACHRPAVYDQQKPCPEDCAGNGLCMNGLCLCNVGFHGPGCADEECEQNKVGPGCKFTRCPLDCNGQGLCLDGECSCQEGFSGQDCSMPQQCLTTCRNVCGGPEGGKESTEKCIYCIGQCITNKNPFLGHHDPFADFRGTLLQASHRPNGAESIGDAARKLRGNFPV